MKVGRRGGGEEEEISGVGTDREGFEGEFDKRTIVRMSFEGGIVEVR